MNQTFVICSKCNKEFVIPVDKTADKNIVKCPICGHVFTVIIKK